MPNKTLPFNALVYGYLDILRGCSATRAVAALYVNVTSRTFHTAFHCIGPTPVSLWQWKPSSSVELLRACVLNEEAFDRAHLLWMLDA